MGPLASGAGPTYQRTMGSAADGPAAPLAEALSDVIRRRAAARSPLVVGLCGAQGSGKSTVAGAIAARLSRDGLSVATLSLDDLYLARAERQALARRVHPLLATRGPPGTHDAALGLEVLRALRRGESLDLPAFDKAADDRRPRTDWARFEGPAEVVLFEGWCVGARPEPEAALAAPVNGLERQEDPDGVWRGFVNRALAAYQALFAELDLLILLKAPSFGVVAAWRGQQEAELRASGAEGAGLMDAATLGRFIQHYERLTRWMLREMPGRADVVVELGRRRELREIRLRQA